MNDGNEHGTLSHLKGEKRKMSRGKRKRMYFLLRWTWNRKIMYALLHRKEKSNQKIGKKNEVISCMWRIAWMKGYGVLKELVWI